MGRFDALTQLEEKLQKPTPSQVPFSTASKTQQPVKARNEVEKKPANLQTSKTVSLSPTLDSIEKPEKYTTRLEPSLVRKLRIYAAEKEIKDYEVVKKALNEYFEKIK